jgi:vacuolar protein-sorting-associated protein 4
MRRNDLSLRYMGDGSSIVRNAVAMDKSGNYEQAKTFYQQAASKFKLALGQKDITSTNAAKAKEYLDRCEARINEIDSFAQVPAPVQSSGGAAQAKRPTGPGKDNKGGKGGGGGGGGKGGADDENAEFANRISSAILIEKPDIKWSDVAGLAEAKRALMEAVILPLKFKQFFTGERSPWRGILLYGPPGTGKSFLAKATASEANSSTFLTVSTSDLVSKWLGESEKLIRALFETARNHAPAIIFIDEIDSLLSERSENDSESSRRIKTEFLIQMDGVGKSMEGILLLSATNIPWGLDPAVRRRFEKKIYIPLPDFEARKAMIENKMRKTLNNLTPQQMDNIANMTEGYSGADIKILTREAAMLAVRKLQEARYFREYEGHLYPCGPTDPGAVQISLMDPDFPAEKVATPPVTYEDFKESIGRIRPSVSPSDLTRFEEWTKEFGQDGSGA